MRRWVIAIALLGVACKSPTSNPGSSSPDGTIDTNRDASAGATGLHVVMGTGGAPGHLVDGSGTTVMLHGADRSGTEYSCLYGGFFDGPADQASLDAMKSWHLNAVRVPLNEDCWLGISGAPAAQSGAAYQAAIRTYVSLLEQNGMIVILDLHWAAPGSQLANKQLGMADADHAPTFWTQVATAYKGEDDHVIFDLFNEPFITDWDCWLKGGMCAQDGNGDAYMVAGMASLLGAVRTAGADNVVIMGGLAYSSDFTHWLDQVNTIPTLDLTLDNIAVSWHTYSDQSVQTLCPTMYNGYDTNLSCVDGATNAANYGVTPLLAAGFPVVIGEIGTGAYATNIAPYTTAQANQLDTWLESALTYMDSQQQGYLAWDWNTESPPLLLTNFDGTPSPYFGVTYKAHLAND